MRRLCMRSACVGEAVVLVEMNVKEISFTIRDLDEVAGPGQVVLCQTHVGRLRAPRGWELVDERSVGRLVPFPDRDGEQRPPRRRHPTRSDETVRSITDARHPLDVDRSAPTDQPSPKVTPLLARAFTGADRHPSTALDDGPEAEVFDPFGDESWDQRTHRDEEADSADPDQGTQMEFDSFDFEPSA
ncbi:MAG: DUF3499 family protein [Actinomycetota bacterium]|nr:DUF3499 family protein [Actinomycetota bacterium]